jgi:hypothetical protein
MGPIAWPCGNTSLSYSADFMILASQVNEDAFFFWLQLFLVLTRTATARYLNDLWVFDTQEYKWTQVESKATDPRPSYVVGVSPSVVHFVFLNFFGQTSERFFISTIRRRNNSTWSIQKFVYYLAA